MKTAQIESVREELCRKIFELSEEIKLSTERVRDLADLIRETEELVDDTDLDNLGPAAGLTRITIDLTPQQIADLKSALVAVSEGDIYRQQYSIPVFGQPATLADTINWTKSPLSVIKDAIAPVLKVLPYVTDVYPIKSPYDYASFARHAKYDVESIEREYKPQYDAYKPEKIVSQSSINEEMLFSESMVSGRDESGCPTELTISFGRLKEYGNILFDRFPKVNRVVVPDGVYKRESGVWAIRSIDDSHGSFDREFDSLEDAEREMSNSCINYVRERVTTAE